MQSNFSRENRNAYICSPYQPSKNKSFGRRMKSLSNSIHCNSRVRESSFELAAADGNVWIALIENTPRRAKSERLQYVLGLWKQRITTMKQMTAFVYEASTLRWCFPFRWNAEHQHIAALCDSIKLRCCHQHSHLMIFMLAELLRSKIQIIFKCFRASKSIGVITAWRERDQASSVIASTCCTLSFTWKIR